MISPTERPLTAMLRKSKCNSRFFEWQTESLAAAANNAQIEGDDVTSFTAITPTTRWGNYTQISTKNFVISMTEEVVDKAGRKSEIARQKLNKTKEILRDQEVALTQNTTQNAGALGTARQTRGLAGWITQGSVGAGTGAFPVPGSNTAPVAGTPRAWSEALLKDAQQKAWTAGGNPTTALMRAADKQLTSAFTGNVTRFNKVETEKLVAAFDVYVGDFGELKIVPSRFIDAAVYLIDPEHAELKTLRNLEVSPLAKTGDAEKYLLTYEYGLQMSNKDAHAQVRDLT
jgi:hypothetical protein